MITEIPIEYRRRVLLAVILVAAAAVAVAATRMGAAHAFQAAMHPRSFYHGLKILRKSFYHG